MSLHPLELFRIGDFTLDRHKRTVKRNGIPVPLSPKGFDVLTYLVMNPGRVVTKEELLKAVWPESFVEEGNLTQHISGLRKALGDGAGFIVTVPRQGYQFTGEVRRELTQAPAEIASDNELLVRTVREQARIIITDVAPDIPKPIERPAPTYRWKRISVAGGIALVVLGAAALGIYRWTRPKPEDYHKIVIADFDNRTGDDVFDFVLKSALEVNLQQSPLLTAVSIGETRRTLEAMGHGPDEKLTLPLAREVCERDEAQAVLGGLILKLDQRYVVTL